MHIFRPLILFFVSFFCTLATFGQDNKDLISIKWQEYDKIRPGKAPAANMPTFEGARQNDVAGLPYYLLRLEGRVIPELTLENPVYAAFTPWEAALFPKSFSQAAPEVTVFTHYENKKPVSFASFVPVRRNPQSGALEKLVSFSYTYKTDATAQRQKRTHRQYASNSVLSSGEWYRIGVISTGMYKIDRAALQEIGINPNNVDPRNIRIYGNGGGILPQANSAFRHDDLAENHIYVEGESDGRFDNGDFILFYGEGPHTWALNKTTSRFEHIYNFYSDTTYYFINVGSAPGKRVSTSSSVTGATQTISTFNDRWFHEKEEKNFLKSGREWFGEEFNSFSPAKDFAATISAADLAPNSKVYVTSSVIGATPFPNSTTFTVKLNGNTLGTQQMGGYNASDPYRDVAVKAENTFTINSSSLNGSSPLTINLAFGLGSVTSSQGHLNYLELNTERPLQLNGTQQSFRSVKSMASAVSTYQIGNVSGAARVWDITNPVQPKAQQITLIGNTGTFSAKSDSLREYIVFSGSDFVKPFALGKTGNQNLHSLAKNPDIDLIIVSHPDFRQQANRLADHRRQKGMTVEVVTPRQIYNEFSSGAQDVTAIRDFMKMVYDHSNKGPNELIYLLLFGDASYDYKSNHKDNIKNRTPDNTNFVPCYESRGSLSPVSRSSATYSSEDYYGFLDDDEGIWAEDPTNLSNHGLDIGIGRLPARTALQAEAMVSKIISYEQTISFGKWRNRVTLVADDADGSLHQRAAETLARIVEFNHQKYNTQKVYVDMYEQPSATNGQRAPDANRNIDKAIEQGTLIMNYVGHGGETGWAAEQILTIPQINNWSNAKNLAFLVTATCEFGRYDDPARASGAEYALLNEKGGAIGLLTTTRPVYSDGNELLNINFFEKVFTPVNGRMPRLGDLMQQTKNSSFSGLNNRNFALLGDPSMMLAYPELTAQVTKINGNPINPANPDTIKALSKVTLEGNITDGTNTLVNFDGKIQATVFEKRTPVNTRGDEGDSVVEIMVRENIIYDGLASVKAGKFSVTFVVPKDIAYNFGFGKISLYAFNDQTDGNGGTTQLLVGGSADTVNADNNPPQITLFMDDESFKFGGMTGTNSTLLAHLFDDNGINTAGIGIGHEITATLDGSKENIVVLNDYYTADIDKFESGKVRYLFKNLAKGPHSLKVKAWDTHNNSNEAYIEFIVASTEKMALEHVLNYPNPFTTHTTFHFDHNRAGDDLDIQIQIFTVSGKLIKTLNAASFASSAHIDEIKWDGRDDFQDRIGKGVYVYKVSVASRRDGSKTSKFEKLVILN